MDRSIIGKKCEFYPDEDCNVKETGKIIGFNPNNDELLVYVNSSNRGHSADNYEWLLREGWKIDILEELFELLRKDNRFWYVISDLFIGFVDNEILSIETTVDESGKIIITKT